MLTSLVPTTPLPIAGSPMNSPADVLAVAQLAVTMPMALEAFVFPMRPNNTANTVIAITDLNSMDYPMLRDMSDAVCRAFAQTPGIAKVAIVTTRPAPWPNGKWVKFRDRINLLGMRGWFDRHNIKLTCWIIISPEGAWSVDDYREEYEDDVQSA